jgi:hypothetical protein
LGVLVLITGKNDQPHPKRKKEIGKNGQIEKRTPQNGLKQGREIGVGEHFGISQSPDKSGNLHYQQGKESLLEQIEFKKLF